MFLPGRIDGSARLSRSMCLAGLNLLLQKVLKVYDR